MKGKRIWIFMIMAAFTISGTIGYAATIKDIKDEALSIVFSGKIDEISVKAGETSKIQLPIKAVGGSINSPTIEVTPKEVSSDFVISNVSLTATGSDLTPEIIPDKKGVNLEFDINVKKTAKAKKHQLVAYVTYLNEEEEKVTSSLEFQIKIIDEKTIPELVFKRTAFHGFKAGEESIITLGIKNVGESTAKNVKLTLDFGDTGVSLKSGENILTMGDILGNKENSITFPIKVDSKTTPGKKNIKVELSYQDENNKVVTQDEIFVITIEDETKDYDIEIESTNYNTNLRPGKDLILVATLYNKGEKTANNIKVSVDESSINSGVFIKKYLSEFIAANDLEPGERINVKIPLTIAESAEIGRNELAIIVKYGDENNEKSTSIKVFPEILKKDDQNESDFNDEAELKVSDITTNPETLQFGRPFKLEFTLENTHDIISATGIKITIIERIDGKKSPIIVEGNKVITIDELKPGAMKEISMDFKVRPHLGDGRYSLQVKIDYKSGAVEAESINRSRTLTINRTSEALIKNLIITPKSLYQGKTFIGDKLNLEFELHNAGKAVLRNVTAMVGGDFVLGDSERVIIGDIDGVLVQKESFDITAIKEGLAQGNMIITYEDEGGELVILESDFELDIAEVEKVAEDGKKDKDGMSILAIIFSLLGVGGLAAALVVIVRKYLL